MKYLKYFEKKGDNKRLGLYVNDNDILYILEYLKEKNVLFTLLYGKEYDDDEKYFLILISLCGDLPYEQTETGYKDYYIEFDENVNDSIYLNWFDLEEVYSEGDWIFVPDNDPENVKMLINANKYNL